MSIRTTVTVVEGAFDALQRGNTEQHDTLVHAAMDRLAQEVDVLVLGQISLMRIQHQTRRRPERRRVRPFAPCGAVLPAGRSNPNHRSLEAGDAWTVFLDEREQLIHFWDSLGKPVFVLTGDLHNSFAIKITDRVWEFASGPHSSANHRAGDEGDRPPNGLFDSLGRKCEIRWSSYFLDDMKNLLYPFYCVVQINNVFNNPLKVGDKRWVAFPRPQVIFQYFDGLTGDLSYAESILAARNENQ